MSRHMLPQAERYGPKTTYGHRSWFTAALQCLGGFVWTLGCFEDADRWSTEAKVPSSLSWRSMSIKRAILFI
jgi:hypothetical protein